MALLEGYRAYARQLLELVIVRPRKRGLARVLWLLVPAAGCYSPQLRDCTVTCAASAECASGQVCGSDHFCAQPARAGQCSGPNDGGTRDADSDAQKPPHDARPDARPDAGNEDVVLHVHIDGGGRVVLDDTKTCGSMMDPEMHDCALGAPRGQLATLQAIPHTDQMFDRWENPAACMDQQATCMFVPLVDTDVAVRFRKVDK